MKKDKKIATLTPRQLEAFELILLGKDNHQIALKMGISYTTAKLISHQVLKKLDLKSKNQALAKYLR